MGLFNPVRSFGFRFAKSRINQSHPLAPSLIFFGVPWAGGFRDLVSGQNLTPVGKPFPATTPFGIGWQTGPFGGNDATRLGHFVTPTNPAYQPAANVGMSVCAGVYNPLGPFYGGGVNRLVEVTSGTDTTGVLWAGYTSSPEAVVGGSGGTSTVFAPDGGTNGVAGPHSMMGTYTNGAGGLTTLSTQQSGGGINTGAGLAKTLAGLSYISIGDPGDTCGRPILWAAVWQTALSTALMTLAGKSLAVPPVGLLTRR
jgi:hypothetical protein